MATTPRVRIAVPSEGPLITAILVCPTCGQGVLPTLTRMGNGRISSVTFYHVNEDFGCAWKNVDPMRRTSGETSGLVENVRSGGDSQGRPNFINEFDLAKGRSFDLDGLKPQSGIDLAEVISLPQPAQQVPGADRKFVIPTQQGRLIPRAAEPPTTPAPPKDQRSMEGDTGEKPPDAA